MNSFYYFGDYFYAIFITTILYYFTLIGANVLGKKKERQLLEKAKSGTGAFAFSAQSLRFDERD